MGVGFEVELHDEVAVVDGGEALAEVEVGFPVSEDRPDQFGQLHVAQLPLGEHRVLVQVGIVEHQTADGKVVHFFEALVWELVGGVEGAAEEAEVGVGNGGFGEEEGGEEKNLLVLGDRQRGGVVELGLEAGEGVQDLLHESLVVRVVDVPEVMFVGHPENEFDDHVRPVEQLLVAVGLEEVVEHDDGLLGQPAGVQHRHDFENVGRKADGVGLDRLEDPVVLDGLGVQHQLGESGVYELVEKELGEDVLADRLVPVIVDLVEGVGDHRLDDVAAGRF